MSYTAGMYRTMTEKQLMFEVAKSNRTCVFTPVITNLPVIALLLITLCLSLFTMSLSAAELLRGLPDRPKSLHPHHFGGSPDAQVIKDMYEGLMVQNRNGEPVLGAAQDVEISEDRLNYTFKLRGNLRWSDGSALTGKDFVRSFRALADPTNKATYRWYLRIAGIKGAERALAGNPSVLGVSGTDQTFTIKLSQPSPDLLALLTFPSFLPVAPIQENGLPISNGPYFLEENHDNQRIVLRKNPVFPRSQQSHHRAGDLSGCGFSRAGTKSLSCGKASYHQQLDARCAAASTRAGASAVI